MKGVRYFFTYAGLALAFQGVILFTLGRSDAFLEKFLFLYYPTIWIVERCGNFTGESNLIQPILIGVSFGGFLYSVLLASILTFIRKLKRNS